MAGVLAALLVGALVAVVAITHWTASHRRTLWALARTGWDALLDLPAARRIRERWPWLSRVLVWLTPSEYLGIHLALGLVLSAAALAFVSLAEAVGGGEALARFDVALANALHASASPDNIRFMLRFTDLGSGEALTALGVAVAVGLFIARQTVLAVGWVIAMLGAGVLNFLLKAIFERARPEFTDPFVVSSGWSFPSGHSMGTLIACGMLAYFAILALESTPARVAVVALALVWTLFMGFSRMYLGVHYLSDVIAGFAAGTVWVAACVSGVEVVRRRGLDARRLDGPAGGR